jgi:serine/threonine-protein kinase RsbW
MAPPSSDRADARADVSLRVPADGAYVSVLRTTTAGLAARLDFLLDDIEDLRIAVGEAFALVLPLAGPGTDLSANFWLAPGSLTISVGVQTAGPESPDYDSFAWQVLNALASSATAKSGNDRFDVVLTMESGIPDLSASTDAGVST